MIFVLAFAVTLFLAAFFAGITVATVSPEARTQFQIFGERVTELLKLAALLIFGALMSFSVFTSLQASGYIFAALVLVAVRPIALAVALLRSGLSWPEWITAAWFGPKGFASVVYELLILKSGIKDAEPLAQLAAVVVAASIIAHSSTDVMVARWFHIEEPKQPMLSR
jgi:NhaP-type Na+/H+ or K+/H+ antiporter